MDIPDLSSLNLASIARIARADWSKAKSGIFYAAEPYLKAMGTMADLNGYFGAERGDDIVLRFLANASSWRGPVAKAVKAELNKRLKGRGL